MSEEEKNIIALKQRAEEMLKNDYSRKIGDEEIYTLICEWEKTLDLYQKEKENNKKKSIETIEYQDLLENSISKDKIREKIKEYLQNGMWKHQNAIDFILEELLEEKEKEN